MKYKLNLFQNMFPHFKNLLIFSIFILILCVVFKESLNLSLWGDDWQMFFLINNTYGPGNPFPYLSFKGYLEPHGVMKMLVMILRSFFGYNGFGYYLTALVFRAMSAFVGYLFLSKFTKSRLIGFTGSTFMLLGYTGIDTTNYMVHMTTYLVLIFFIISLIYFIDSYKNSFGKFILGCMFFTIGLCMNPLRSHGLLIFLLFFDAIYGYFIEKSKLLNLFSRAIFISVSAFIVYRLGIFGATKMGFINLSTISDMLKNNNFTFISAFATTFGKTLFPDYFTVNLTVITKLFGANWYKWVIMIGFLIETAIYYVLSRFLRQKPKSRFVALSLLTILFFLAGLIFRSSFRGTELFTNLIFTFIGIFFIVFGIWSLYILFTSKKTESNIGFVGMAAGPFLILTSLIVPLFFTPGRVLESSHRYMTISLLGLAIIISSFLKLIFDKSKNIPSRYIYLIGILLLINIHADKKYFSELIITRNPKISDYIWKQFTSYVPPPKRGEKILYYFDDSENVRLASDAFLYGLPPRMGIKYSYLRNYQELPALTTLYDEVVSAVTDGKSFKRLGYPEEKIDINQVYAFKISKEGTLTDITQLTRRDLVISINHD